MLRKVNKKGLAAGQLVMIIIVLVAFVLIAGTVSRFMSKAEPKEAEIMCYNSINMRVQSSIQVNSGLVEGNLKLIPPMCKTIDLKITGNREELLEQIAYASARCWWMFGEGRYEDLLRTTGESITVLPSIFNVDHYDNKCFNCYTLLVDQDEIEGGNIGPEDIQKYMVEKDHRQIKGLSYLDYIQSYGGPGRMVFTMPVIAPRESYSISIVPKLAQKTGSFWNSLGKFIVGAAVVIAVVGGVACVVATAGACAAVLGPAGAALAATGAVMTGSSLAIGITVAGGLAAGYVGTKSYMEMVNKFFDASERDVSSVFVSFLEVGQQKCGSGDLAGE